MASSNNLWLSPGTSLATHSAKLKAARVVSRIDVAVAALILTGGAACSDLSRFDTGKDAAYCGTIVGAPFVRQGFERQIQAELRLDTSALNTLPGTLTTHRDSSPCEGRPLFEGAVLRAPTKLESDPLSQLEFGEGRELNLLTWVDSTCDGTYLAVVSLMHDNSVELRLLQSKTTQSGGETGPLGVFPLSRSVRGCGDD